MNRLATQEPSSIVPLSGQMGAWSAHQVIAQVCLIQEVKAGVMRDGEHYGTIPGTDKPTLLKSGAEKLALTFRLAASYQIDATTSPMNAHREYTVTCTLTHLVSGAVWGQGVGLCSTMESKYRYRSGYEPTGKSVPKEYWKDRDVSLLGGKGFSAKKIDGQWQIMKVASREENPDLADTYNTVLKMAKKRAFVDAILTATGGSDFFTQDLEELAGVEEEKTHSAAVEPSPQETKAQKFESATPPAGEQIIEGVIEEVIIKEGKHPDKLNKEGKVVKEGAPWKKYGIVIKGVTYGTFDKPIGLEAETRVGQPVILHYKHEGKYLTCLDMEIVAGYSDDAAQGYEPELGVGA